MNNLKLPNPKMMDVAVPANMHVGLHQDELAKQGWHSPRATGRPDILLVDLREVARAAKRPHPAGALHAPYPAIDDSLKPGGMLREVATATGRRTCVFFCAYGERSAMAVAAAKEAGLTNSAHIAGGIDAWKSAGGVDGLKPVLNQNRIHIFVLTRFLHANRFLLRLKTLSLDPVQLADQPISAAIITPPHRVSRFRRITIRRDGG